MNSVLTNPTVSCIIPVYNGARFMQATLESVLAQSQPVHEIIVADDGSTDETRAVVEACAATSARPIHYLWQENAGVAAARNLGLQAATGEFLAFIDADDLWQPEKLACQLARFVARPELGISVTHIQNFWMDEVSEEAARLQDHPRSKPMAGYIFSTLMIRRTVFAQIGIFDTTWLYAEGTEWLMRAQDAQVVDELLPDVLVMRRMHLNNSTRINAQASHAEYFRLVKKRTRTSSSSTSPPTSSSTQAKSNQAKT